MQFNLALGNRRFRDNMKFLNDKRILIVEDNFLVALDLGEFFAQAGAMVLGPTPDLAQAGPFAAKAEAAILDITLRGGTVFPLADQLAQRGVPFVFYTASDDIRIPDRFRHVSRMRKPETARIVAAALVEQAFPEAAEPQDTMLMLLPKLRLAARLILNDTFAADRLVEATLAAAVAGFPDRPRVPTARWLNKLMRDELAADGRRFLN